MSVVCEYPSLAIEGETLRVERTAGRYQICRLDRRGRRIRSMTMDIDSTTAAAHILIAHKVGEWVSETPLKGR